MPFRHRLIQSACLVALTTIVAGACTTTGANRSSGLANTEWVLGSIEGAPVASGSNASLGFGLVQASGFGGCNQFTTAYQTAGSNGLKFGDVASTQMACETLVALFESNYFAALAKVVKFVVADTTLTLYDRTNTEVLAFGAAAPATVEGPWTVLAVNNGQGAVASVPTGISAAVSFMADGTVEGFGGCNNFSGVYTVRAGTITIGPLMGTRMACAEPANTFEAQFLAALENSTKWSVSGDKLDLRDDSGAQQVSAQSAIGH